MLKCVTLAPWKEVNYTLGNALEIPTGCRNNTALICRASLSPVLGILWWLTILSQLLLFEDIIFLTGMWNYGICPNRSTCPNKRAPLCSKKHITSNSHQMPDKTCKTSRNTKIRAILQSVCLPHMRETPLPCKQRSMWFLFTIYMRIVGIGRQALLLKLIDAHPSPCTHALRFY